MAMNFMIYPMGMLGFYVCGFAFMFGGIGRASARWAATPGLNHEITASPLRQALRPARLERLPAAGRRL